MPRPPKRQFVEISEGEEYPHMITWQVVLRQIEAAELEPKGSAYCDLIAMVFAAHTIEGYTNFIGEKIDPAAWKDEETFFRGVGTAGKLAHLHQLLGLPVPDKGRRPHSTVGSLKTLRDYIAHPKIKKSGGSTTFYEGKEPPLFAKSHLLTMVSHQKAVRARDDVRSVVDTIQAAAIERFPDANLTPDGLEGITGMRSSSIKLHVPEDL